MQLNPQVHTPKHLVHNVWYKIRKRDMTNQIASSATKTLGLLVKH